MVGIISNSAALFAQTNLERAALESQSSIARLSSGQSIIRASDDVAGLAIGTVLGTNVTTLRTALTSTSQASSLLQLADGGAKNIADILQRQKALAVQANSGTLSDNERAFLNEEFQSLASQIDQTVLSTKFNTVSLIDGSIFDKADITTNVDNIGAAATAQIDFGGGNAVADEIININGVGILFTADGAGDSVQIGVDEDATINNLVEFINNSDNVALQAITASGDLANDVITLTARENGTAGNSLTITDGTIGGAANFALTAFAGGVDGDLNGGDVSFGASDVVGDNILVALDTAAPARASATIQITADVTNSGDSVVINGVAFAFGTGTGDVNIAGGLGADAQALFNAIIESDAADLDGVSVTFDGVDTITVTANAEGNAGNGITFTSTGAPLVIDAGAPPNAGFLAGGNLVDTGVDVSNITNNASFVGTISGFEATYVADNQVTLEVTIGDEVYTATVADTNATTDSFVRFTSSDTGSQGGGYFDILLAANQGEAVTNQSDANLFASRLDLAFSTVSFYQDRDVADSSYVGAGDIYVGSVQTGTLAGSSVDFNIADFSQAQIADLTVSAPAQGSSDGEITITLANGDVFSTGTGLGDVVANTPVTVTLTSESNPNETIDITFGTADVDGSGNVALFQTDDQAQALQDALKSAFGLGNGGGGLDFQVGLNLDDTIKVAIGDLSTTTLYRDTSGVTQTLDISSVEGAQEASDVLDLAINRLTTERANIGALQSRFSFASAGITTSIQNTEAARSDFLDVDIAEESTSFATAQVRLQASISVLAQANQLPQNLLKLLG